MRCAAEVGKELSEVRTTDIPKQRLSEFRKLAEIPMDKFKERIEVAKVKEEKITYQRLLRGEPKMADERR